MRLAPRIKLERFAHEEYRKHFGGQQPVRFANVNALFEMGADVFFEYRGIPFRVPPVPARIGAELMRIRAEITQRLTTIPVDRPPTPKEIGEYQAMLIRTQSLVTQCVRPCSRIGRLKQQLGLWRPFLDASDAEIRELLDFLWLRRATSTIRFYDSGQTAHGLAQ